MKYVPGIIMTVMLSFFSLEAGCPGPCPGPGPGPCPPPPPGPHCHPHYHCGYRGSSGLADAAAIVSIVGNSVVAAKALTTPTVVAQPVVQTVPVATAQPQTVVVQQAKPQPRSVTIMPDGTRIEKY